MSVLPKSVKSWKHLTVGNRVKLRGGSMKGRLTGLTTGGFSNGGLPMGTVHWESGSTSRVTASHLQTVKEEQ